MFLAILALKQVVDLCLFWLAKLTICVRDFEQWLPKQGGQKLAFKKDYATKKSFAPTSEAKSCHFKTDIRELLVNTNGLGDFYAQPVCSNHIKQPSLPGYHVISLGSQF